MPHRRHVGGRSSARDDGEVGTVTTELGAGLFGFLPLRERASLIFQQAQMGEFPSPTKGEGTVTSAAGGGTILLTDN